MSLNKLKLLTAVGASLFLAAMQAATAGEVNAAVAANFTAPMQQIADAFQKDSGHTVKLSFGSTGKFYAQIKNGAPFDVFVAADSATPERLESEGQAVAGSGFVYAVGKLVLWSAKSGFVDDKGAVLSGGKYNKVAIGDPKLAAYGAASREVMQALGVWNAVQDKLVKGENITQTYQFAATGNADLGFIALSQITKGGKVTGGSYWLVPSKLYKPIMQSAVLLSGAKDQAAAKAFLAYIKSDKAAAIIRSFGYELP